MRRFLPLVFFCLLISLPSFADFAPPVGFFGKCHGLLSSNYRVRRLFRYVEDQKIWGNFRKNDEVIVYGYLDNKDLQAVIAKALKRDHQSEASIYETGGPVEEAAYKSFLDFKHQSQKAVAQDKGYDWTYRFAYTVRGSDLLIQASGPKWLVQKVLKTLKLKTLWLGEEGDPLPGNTISVTDRGIIQATKDGARTVHVVPTTNLGLQIGLARMEMKDGSDGVDIHILYIDQIPFSRIAAEDVDGVSWGLTQEQLFSLLRADSPELEPDSKVTVINIQRR